jgi:glutamate--cysteine ligase
MPGNVRQITVDHARAHLRSQCLAPSPTTGRVGLECEWHVVPANQPCAVVPLAELRGYIKALGPLPGGSTVTYEPGGQLELSGPALGGVGASAAVAAMTADVDAVRRYLARVDIALVGTGVDALRRPQRLLCAPRYDAMEAYFDTFGPHGRVMMTRTAALQLNLDNGVDADEIERRWRRVHVLGPTLVAAFANSPLAGGIPTGWRSTRLANGW